MKLNITDNNGSFFKNHLFIFLIIILSGFLFGLPFSGDFLRERNDEIQAPDTTITSKKNVIDSVYLSILAKAQGLYLNEKYAEALAEYEKAAKRNPGDTRLEETIEKVKSLLAKQRKDLEDYQKTILSADNYFKVKDYLDAKNAYQLALDLKPDDPYAKERLRQTMELIRSQKAQNTLYDMAIASAEKFYQAKDYEKAKLEFEKAKKILPDDKYANERINEIIKILVDKASTDEMYATAIASADKFFNEKKYQGALKEYQNATVYKPEEKYPKDRIAEVTELIKAMKAKNEAYNKAIAAADQLFNATSYINAKKEYQNALLIKPEESYPSGRISEIDNILAGKQKITEDYSRLVDIGDSLYMEKKYIAAKANYQQALKLKPAESYPKEMINKADNMIAGQAASAQAAEEAYQLAIKNADEWLKEKSFEKAKTEYQNALLIKPNENYPKTKIAEIDNILAEVAKQKSLDEQYAGLVAQADKKLSEKTYPEAKTVYQSALKIKPDQQYPKDKIREIDNVLAEVEKQKGIDERYAASIARADKLFIEKSLEQARTEFNNAGNLKPEEIYPKQKIAEIDKLFAAAAAEAKAKEEMYKTAVANADQFLAAKNYDQAKTEYQNALLIKPAESYPKAKIGEIDNVLAELARQKSLDEQYAGLIASSDKLLSGKSFNEAKSGYQEALKIKPDQSYPKEKIGEIDNILAEIARKKGIDDQYASSIAKADKLFADKMIELAKAEYILAGKIKPDESYPKEKISEIDKLLADAAAQKELEEKYLSLIADADNSLAAKDYSNARNRYTEAMGLKPGEQYPKDKIAEIDGILAAIADSKAKDEQYKTFINKADKLLAEKSYEKSKSEYLNALAVKPEENYPKTKISEIDQVLAEIARQKSMDEQYTALIASADKLLSAKSYNEAKTGYEEALRIKPDQQYPKNKIGEIDIALAEIARLKALDDQYSEAIKNADQYFSEKKLEQAKTGYLAAENLKTGESYPKQKIKEIDKLLADAAAQKVLDEKYQSIILNADNLFAAKDYAGAKNEYSKASGLKPIENYPKDKISEIDGILASIAEANARDAQYKSAIDKADKLFAAKSYGPAKSEYQNALLIKPGEAYPQAKVAEIDLQLEAIAKQKALDDQYAGLIAVGDKKLAEKSYEEAKTAYQSATDLKPDQQYPKGKITEIDKTLADISRKKALDEQYNLSIAKAEQLLADNLLDESRAEFMAAGNLKPAETYPKEKIAAINKLKDQIAQQKILDGKYDAAIQSGDNFLSSQNYNNAKIKYAEALALKQDQQYPKDKIQEIDDILAELKAREESYKASIAKADQFLLRKSYEEARNEYTNASLIKPAEQYPQNKITEINNTLMEMKGKRQTYDDLVMKGDEYFGQKDYYRSQDNFKQASSIFPEESYPKERLNRITVLIDSIYRANKGKYDKAVTDGDKAYANLIYDKALDFYGEALTYLPMEKYPREMIGKIKRAIAENAIVDVLKTSVIITQGDQKQISFEPVNMASRKNNYLYIKIKNLSDKPFNVLVRYGKDNQTNGGAVIRNLQGDGNVYDRLISVRDQDPWYREDNNWIALLPQGGDVEVTFIQISRAAQ